MKNYLILILVIGMSTSRIYGQVSSDIYIIGTSIANHEITGFDRSTQEMEPIYASSPIFFYIRSNERGFEICLEHFNFDTNELSKIREVGSNDTMTIVDKPMTFLNNINPIDVGQFIQNKTKDQAVDWAWSNSMKKIWIIDRNDFYKSSPSLSSPDRIKLIEARISTFYLPEHDEESFE